MDNKDSKSIIHIVIGVIICVLLVVLIVIGGIFVYKGSNNNTNNPINNKETQIEDKSKSEESTENNKEKDDKNEKTTEDKNEEDKPVQVENKSEITIVQPETKVIVKEITTPVSGIDTGDEYIADVYEYLSLRSAASVTAPVIAQISPRTEMIILKVSTDPMVCVKITSGSYSGYTGYVNENYITKKGHSLIRASYSNSYYYVYGTKEYLPMRSIAALDDRYEIERLYNGDMVLLISKTNDKFWKVKDINSGKIGYVVNSYLR